VSNSQWLDNEQLQSDRLLLEPWRRDHADEAFPWSMTPVRPPPPAANSTPARS